MTQIHNAAASYYGRWDDANKNWEDAELLGTHVEAQVVADIIVDTPEEVVALPDDEPVIVPEENVAGPVVKEEEGETKDDEVDDPEDDETPAPVDASTEVEE